MTDRSAQLSELTDSVVTKAQDGKGCAAFEQLRALSVEEMKAIWNQADTKSKDNKAANPDSYPQTKFELYGTDEKPAYQLERKVSPRQTQILMNKFEVVEEKPFTDGTGQSKFSKTIMVCADFPKEYRE